MGGSWAGKCELCGQGAAAPRSQLAPNPSFMSNAHAKVQLCLLCHNALPQRARAYPNTLVVGITMCFAPPHLCSCSLPAVHMWCINISLPHTAVRMTHLHHCIAVPCSPASSLRTCCCCCIWSVLGLHRVAAQAKRTPIYKLRCRGASNTAE